MADAVSSRDAVCIIPARGGSKRIPGKNIRPLGGLPLIAYSIRAALQSNCFARVIVSTDDEAIAQAAADHGAQTPFVRSAELANDFATTADALADAIERSGESSRPIICCLYATAPMVLAQDFIDARESLVANKADCVMSVTDYDFAPQRALSAAADGTLSFVHPEFALTRSQGLTRQVHDAGMFYMLANASFAKSGQIVSGRTFGHFIERARAIDIDTPEDFEFAEMLFEMRKRQGRGS